jgi:hypothetical protein
MKKLVIVLPGVFIIALLALSTANANDARGYIGFQLGKADIEDTDLNYGLARVGIKYPNNIAAEVRYGVGANSKTTGGVQVEIDRIIGVYGAYHFDLSDKLSLYGIVGWSEVVINSSDSVDSVDTSQDGISYGIGAEFHGFNVEWMQYLDTEDVETQAIAIGYNYHFD